MTKMKFTSRKNLFQGFVGVDELKFSLPEKNQAITRTVVTRPDATAILLYNKTSHKVVLIKQFRAPVYTKDNDGVILEVPAGVIEQGESPQETIIRETLEEVGYRITNPQLLTSFYPTTGLLNEIIHLYFSVVEDKDKVGEGGGVEAEAEYLEVTEIEVDKALELLDKGQLIDAKTIIAILYLKNWLSKNS
jgi:nudix-type nucleoside diphosphatase (YffH/AdpP family)